ncbi:MAG: hypothetical protein EOP83_20945 [Verrucomicrobiaceae bacterium]|nr:MAG: hypothetical protein EOP83_20945 [Verrucomicrobiaceae bacterium]
MLRIVHRDILNTTLDIGIEDNIVRVSQAVFPHEVIIAMPEMPNDDRLREANAWCSANCGHFAYIRQYRDKMRYMGKNSAWAAFHYRYYFMQENHAFHFKMIYG